MKDNFSTVAQPYAKYRPDYPLEMVDFVVSQVGCRDMALDVGTGNGQVAEKLARHFRSVYATDISAKQLANAVHRDNVYYSVSAAEKTVFRDGIFNLITVAQAIHWFDFEEFYTEVRRIAARDGVLAVMGYGLLRSNPESDAIIHKYHYDILGNYWDSERHYLDQEYSTIPFPFEEVTAPKFFNKMIWDFEQLAGYFDTWSAASHYKKQHGSDPFDLVRDELRLSWERNNGEVNVPMLLRVGKIK